METYDIMLLSIIMLVGTALFTGLWTMIGRYLADRRLRVLEADMESVIMTLRSRRGEEQRAASKQDQEEFMQAAGAILASEGDMKDKVMKIVALNPGMAMKMAGKLGLKL